MQGIVEQAHQNEDLLKVDERITATVLVVDDSALQRRIAGQLLETVPEWRVMFASGGKQAIEMAVRATPNIILTDLVMPDMDGLELLELVKAQFSAVPVVLMTSFGSEEVAMRALRAGAANYIPKKDLRRDLVETVRNVLNISGVRRRKQHIMRRLQARESSFQLENDLKLIPPLIQLIEEEIAGLGLLDDISRIRIGVALHEALTNAYYHGNLEISSDLRQEDERIFYALATERCAIDPFASRRVTVHVHVDRRAIRFTIRDEGPGFDTAQLDRPETPEDLMRIGGRGLLLIRTFMDDVQFNAVGNQITMTRRLDPRDSLPNSH